MKLLYLAIISFFFIATSTLAINSFNVKPQEPSSPNPTRLINDEISLVPLPVLTRSDSLPVLSAYSVLAVDVDSGVSLYEKNPDTSLLPASTTKIVTSLVAIDYYHPDEVLTVGPEVNVEGQKMRLVIGEKIKVNDLLYGLLVYSANDAAEVLAKNYPGGKESFVTAMNLKARDLNLHNSNFTNPTGLDGSSHVSSARDLVRISAFAMRNPYFRKIVGTKETVVKSSDEKFVHRLTNINELLGEIEGVLGVKTGWTENAQENLVTYVERGDRKVMIAVLGSNDRFGETSNLIEWIFGNYEWRSVQKPYFP